MTKNRAGETASKATSVAGDPEAIDLRNQVCTMYLDQGLSGRLIAGQLRIDRSTVARILRERGIAVLGRGRGRPRPNRRLADPDNLTAFLQEQYVTRRLDARSIGDLLGMSERTVRDRLAEVGIERRTRGRYKREDRIEIEPQLIIELYGERGMTSDEVAARLGRSRKTVLRVAHEHRLRVRRPASAGSSDSGSICLLTALYADTQVLAVLRRHHVPVVQETGAIWERFPRPVVLTECLARALYEECGVGLHHIELLTGQPLVTVRRRLTEWGVPLRPVGGRCPFLRRVDTSVGERGALMQDRPTVPSTPVPPHSRQPGSAPAPRPAASGCGPIFLVRHGQTALNKERRLRGRIDIPLDAVGRTEAAALGVTFANVPLVAIVSSPLVRAIETAEAIAFHHQAVQVTVDLDLTDRDWGPWSGRPRAEMLSAYPEDASPPGVEPADELHSRVLGAMARLSERAAHGCAVLVVAHDAINGAILSSLARPERAVADLTQHTGCWNRLEHDAQGWVPTIVNAVPAGQS